MPAKGSTGTTRSVPLRSDRGVKLYAPTKAKSRFRVVARGQVERTSASVPLEFLVASQKVKFDVTHLDPVTARARREADEIFDNMVRWSKQQPATLRRGDRTISALCDRRLQDLRDRDCARTTYDKNESLLRLFVRPEIGHVDVAEWNSEHCRQVLRRARKTCGPERIQDLGTILRSLVTLAHRKPAWLPSDENPMEDVAFRVKSTSQSEGVHYVAMKERPSTEQVESLAVAMDQVGRNTTAYLAQRPNVPGVLDRDWGWLLVQVMAKCGPRFGELIALRVSNCARPRAEVEAAIDGDDTLTARDREIRHASIIDLPHGWAIDPGRRLIWITETVEWDGPKPHIAPSEIRASGKETKSKKDRWTMYPRSLLDAVVARCSELLDRFGPEQGPHALLFPEHDHRFVLVPVDSRRPRGAQRWQDQDWWSRSHFRRCMFVKAVAQAQGWPATSAFPFENLRHHFATWAKRNRYPDELISHCMGHFSVSYTQERYFRTGADTIPHGMAASEHL